MTAVGGSAYVYLANSNGSGLTNGDTTADATFTAEASGDQFGIAVLLLDWDLDGTAGLWATAITAEAGGTNRGRAYWYDSPIADQTADDTISGSVNEERLGQSLAGGKFANDAQPRVAVGSHLWDDGGGSTDNSGRVLLAEVPEPLSILTGVAIVSILGARSLQRRRLVRNR